MKKYLALGVCWLSLTSCASTTSNAADERSAEQRAEFNKNESDKMSASISRGGKLRQEAESRAMEDCGTTRFVFPFPYYSPSTRKEETWEYVTSIEWTGGCVAGKRDGQGVLSWTTKREFTTGQGPGEVQQVQVEISRSDGRFVKGLRLGLWCMTYQFTHNGKPVGLGSGCSVLAGHAKPLTANYRKEPAGTWREYRGASPTDLLLAAGALEVQSAKVLADAAAGKTDQTVELVVQSRLLDDLVPGSKIVLALDGAPIPLKDKRVAIVLSSQAVRELERFRRERQALISASSALTSDAATSRAKFIAASNPDRLLVNVVKTLLKHAKTVQPVDDLVGLQNGSFDYAFVFDWKHLTRFDQLEKYYRSPVSRQTDITHADDRKNVIASLQGKAVPGQTGMSPINAGQSMGWFLITRELKAVKQFSPFAPAIRELGGWWPGERGYMGELAQFFEYQWGNGTNDLGVAMQQLDDFLKKN